MRESNEDESEDFVFRGVKITFKLGDILQCQGDILVNPTDQDLSIEKGDCLPASIRKMAGK